MRYGLQSDCATSAMQGLRPLYCEHNSYIHAIVSLIFSKAFFFSVCEIYSVSVRSAAKGLPASFPHIHYPLHNVFRRLRLGLPCMCQILWSRSQRVRRQYLTSSKNSHLLQRTRTDVIRVRDDCVVAPSKLESMLHDGPDRLCNGFRNRDGEARAAKGPNTKRVPLP